MLYFVHICKGIVTFPSTSDLCLSKYLYSMTVNSYMETAINVQSYMHDGWFIPVPIKVGIIHVLGLLSTRARLMMFATKTIWASKKEKKTLLTLTSMKKKFPSLLHIYLHLLI